MDDLVSVSEAALILNVSIDTLRNWDQNGTLTSIKTIGNHRRYTKEQLNQFTYYKNGHIMTNNEYIRRVFNGDDFNISRWYGYYSELVNLYNQKTYLPFIYHRILGQESGNKRIEFGDIYLFGNSNFLKSRFPQWHYDAEDKGKNKESDWKRHSYEIIPYRQIISVKASRDNPTMPMLSQLELRVSWGSFVVDAEKGIQCDQLMSIEDFVKPKI